MQENEEKERFNFEEALLQLQRIVTKLEDDETELEEAITLYEKGLALSKTCSSLLEDAKLRIERIDEK